MHRMPMNAPCLGCQNRVVGCHASCPAYCEYAASRTAEYAARVMDNDIRSYIKERIRQNRAKANKRR